MSVKEYDSNVVVTVGEPAIAYVGAALAQQSPDFIMEELLPSIEDEDDETMDLETARIMIHETVRKVYAAS